MSDLPEVHVIAINVSKRAAVAEEGMGDIRCFLDKEGDETPHLDEASFAVIEWQFGGWSTVEMDDYHSPIHGLN